MDEYVNALMHEFESLLSTFDFQLSTIYFGGGTPTLLSPKHFEKILNLPSAFHSLLSTLEISIEANPGTADKAKWHCRQSQTQRTKKTRDKSHKHRRTIL